MDLRRAGGNLVNNCTAQLLFFALFLNKVVFQGLKRMLHVLKHTSHVVEYISQGVGYKILSIEKPFIQRDSKIIEQ